jgi:hypothetical protein
MARHTAPSGSVHSAALWHIVGLVNNEVEASKAAEVNMVAPCALALAHKGSSSTPFQLPLPCHHSACKDKAEPQDLSCAQPAL